MKFISRILSNVFKRKSGAGEGIRTLDPNLGKGRLLRYCHGNIIPSTMLTPCKPTVKQNYKTRLHYCIYAGLCVFMLVAVFY